MRDPLSVFREYMQLERRREPGLSPADLERWLKLRRHLDASFRGLEPPASNERRFTPRVPTRLDVSFDDYRGIAGALMTNLSRGGVFVETDAPLAIGSDVELRIHISDPETDLVLLGEVASHNVGPDLDTHRRGMGIRFKKLSESDQQRVDELYEQSVAKHLSKD